MTDEAFDDMMSNLDPPMILVTAAVDGERAGCLVGFHAQSSIEPHRYAVWISKANHTYGVVLRASHLSVHFLAAGEHDVAARFGGLTGDEVDKFAGVDVESGAGGVPLLARVEHRLVLRRVAILDEGGDHICVTGEVVRVDGGGGFAPLRLSAVSDLSPGHEPDDHPHGPTG